MQRAFSKRRDHARNGKHKPIDTLRAFDKPHDGEKLTHLHAPQQRGAVADAGVAGYGTDAWMIDHGFDQIGNRRWMQQRITIHANQIFCLRHQSAHAKRHSLALVFGMMHDA